jgi:hypothetical protein
MTSKQILAVCCWFLITFSQAYSVSDTDAFLQGNSVKYTPDQVATVDGEGLLRYGDYQLFAGHYTWNPKNADFKAHDKVKLLYAGATLQGDDLALNLDRHTGELKPAKGDFRGYFLTADSVELQPEQLLATRARVSTCNLDRPHYALQTSKLTLFYSRSSQGKATPERMRLRGGVVQYRGKNIFPLPPCQLNLAKSQDTSANTLPLPYPGYSAADGLFVGYRWGTSWQQDRLKLNLDLKTTARRGMRTVIYSDYSLGSSDFLRLTLSRREDLRDHYLGPKEISTGLSKVLVNRDPEITLNLAPHPIASRLSWQAIGAFGRYREAPTDVSDDRSALTGGLNFGPIPAGPKLSFAAALADRAAHYGNGDDSRVLYGRLTADLKPAPNQRLSLSLVGRDFHGASPFRFDRVDISRELAADLYCPLGKNWRGKFLNRYDLKQEKLRDTGVELTYRAHCLDYNVGWRQTRGLFELSVSLVPQDAPTK